MVPSADALLLAAFQLRWQNQTSAGLIFISVNRSE
jgi:hypothetical protein